MKHKLQHIASTYDLLASDWVAHFANEHDNKPRDKEILALFAQELGNRRPVWDLACGSGCTSAYLNQIGVKTSGLDLSAGLISEAARNYPDIHFQQGNMLALPFHENEIAGFVSFYGIVHFSRNQVQQAFDEVFRALQKGGTFLCTYHVGEESILVEQFLGHAVSIELHYFTTVFISDCLKRSGFDQIAVVERAPYPGVEHPSRRAYAFARKVE